MRVTILILGSLGGLTCGLVGWIQRTELEDYQVQQRIIRAIELYRITSNPALRPREDGEEINPYDEGVRHAGRLRLAATLLLFGLPLGIVGGVLGYQRRKVQAGVLFLVAASMPMLVGSFGAPVVTPHLIWIIAPSALLLLACLLLCFLRPMPVSENLNDAPLPAEREAELLKEHNLYRKLDDREPQPE
jgi:hypothetical protein